MRLSTYFLFVPAVVVAGVLAVANRARVPFSLDPFSDTHPALVIVMPLFLLLFLTLLLGIAIGGLTVALRRVRRRLKPEPASPAKQREQAVVAAEPRKDGA